MPRKGEGLPPHLTPGNPGHKSLTGLAGRPGIGRTPNAIRQALREDFENTRHILVEIAVDALNASGDRKAAIDIMGKYGLGAAQTMLDEEGNAQLPQIVIRREKVDKIKHAEDCPCDVCCIKRGVATEEPL